MVPSYRPGAKLQIGATRIAAFNAGSGNFKAIFCFCREKFAIVKNVKSKGIFGHALRMPTR
jgi:hypothetical protein